MYINKLGLTDIESKSVLKSFDNIKLQLTLITILMDSYKDETEYPDLLNNTLSDLRRVSKEIGDIYENLTIEK